MHTIIKIKKRLKNMYLFSFILFISLAVMGCSGEQKPVSNKSKTSADSEQIYKWKLVTSWPKNFPGLGKGPETFASYVNDMSNGRLQVTVYGAGELVPAFEVFNSVSVGSAEMGHAGAYYWKGKIPAAPIFSAIPFGMNSTEMNAWLHYGNGLKLWRELYAPFGVIPFAGGNSGAQMAGWFREEIHSINDIQGLKMRIPGLGGEVLKQVGGLPITIAGGEIFTSLQSGAIDATEWVGPYNDLTFGLYKAAKNYYHTPWHEPGTQLEFIVNKQAFDSLPKDLQKIVEVATRAVNQDMLDEYTANNHKSMKKLVEEHGVNVMPLPKDVVDAFKAATDQVLAQEIANNEEFARIYADYLAFYDSVKAYHDLSEKAYYINR